MAKGRPWHRTPEGTDDAEKADEPRPGSPSNDSDPRAGPLIPTVCPGHWSAVVLLGSDSVHLGTHDVFGAGRTIDMSLVSPLKRISCVNTTHAIRIRSHACCDYDTSTTDNKTTATLTIPTMRCKRHSRQRQQIQL